MRLIIASRERFLQYKKQGIAPNSKVSIDELYKHPERTPVLPDIIVHKRTDEFNNLLVVEVK